MIRIALALTIACSLAIPAHGQKTLQHRKDKGGTTFAWYDGQTGKFSGHFFVPDEPKPVVEHNEISGHRPMQLEYVDATRKPKPTNLSQGRVASPNHQNRTTTNPTLNPGSITLENPYYQEVQPPTVVDLFFQKIGEYLEPRN